MALLGFALHSFKGYLLKTKSKQYFEANPQQATVTLSTWYVSFKLPYHSEKTARRLSQDQSSSTAFM